MKTLLLLYQSIWWAYWARVCFEAGLFDRAKRYDKKSQDLIDQVLEAWYE